MSNDTDNHSTTDEDEQAGNQQRRDWRKLPDIPETDAVIYLAGPIMEAPSAGDSWREMIIEEFGETVEFRNPLSKYNVPAEHLEIMPGTTGDGETTVGVDEIVESDKAMLRECDAVFVGYSDVQSVGTPMEVMWAYERDIPVCLWVRDETPYDELSPWYRYHVSMAVNSPKLGLYNLCAGVNKRQDPDDEDGEVFF
jgi:nucleoside 2-deoxyribosyltransferase